MKKLDNTTWKHEAKTDPQDRIEVEIGDSKQSKFFPQSKIMRFDNECNYSVRLQDVDRRTIQSFQKDKEKVQWEQGNFKAEFYEGDNSHKFVWYLKSKPPKNKVRFSIQSKNVDFYYQPPLSLTEEEKKKGYSVDKNYDRNGETGHAVLDEKGKVKRFRPINVVGSYAVYHSTKGGVQEKGGMKYRTGKVGHIYRPKLIDAEGKEAWGELNIKNGKYEVTIPQEFLDKASFPIKSNDTFGYESIGGSSASYYQEVFGAIFQIVAGGTITSISAYLYPWEGSKKFRLGIYNAVSNDVTTFLEETAEQITDGTKQWYTDVALTNNVSASANDYYGLALINLDRVSTYYDDATTLPYERDDITYPNWPGTLSGTIYDINRKYSIYATYTPSGGTAFTETLTEANTLQDTLQALLNYAKSLTENISLNDSLQIVASIAKSFSLTEVLSLNDNLDSKTSFFKEKQETESINDSLKSQTDYHITLKE